MKKDTSKTTILLLIFLVIIIIPLSTLINGFAVMKLWNWFIPSIFELRHIGLVQAMGLALVVRYLTYVVRHEHDERDTDEKLMSSIIGAVVVPAIGLALGWIIKSML
jgi:hypothetical protein